MRRLAARVVGRRPVYARASAAPAAAAPARGYATGGGGGVPDDVLERAREASELSDLLYDFDPAFSSAERATALSAALESRGLRLVASGATRYSSWFACDRGTSVRHLVMRGVVWDTRRVDFVPLWQRIGRPSPKAVAPNVVAHGGVLEVAEELWPEIAPVLEALPPGARLSLGGHSLGGSLAMVYTVLARARLGLPAERLLPTYCFGALPVLALAERSASAVPPGSCVAVLDELGLPPDGIRHFVLQNDIVPRAWLAQDPTVGLARSLPGIGPYVGPLLSRTMFDITGKVYFMKWTRERGTTLRALAPEEVVGELAIGADAIRSPDGVMQSVFDHNRRSYAYSLSSLLRLRARRKAGAAGDAIRDEAALDWSK